MHLNVVNTANGLHMLPHRLCHVLRAYCVQRQSHSEQAVSIFSERFSVEKVSPAPEHLAVQYRHCHCIKYHERRELLHSRHNKHSQNRADHAAVDSKPALAGVKDLQQIVLIQIPGENHKIDPRAHNARDHADDPHIQVILRILPCAFCLRCGDKKADQDSTPDNHTIIRDLKSKNADAFPHMIQMDADIRETDVIMHDASPSAVLLMFRRSLRAFPQQFTRASLTLVKPHFVLTAAPAAVFTHVPALTSRVSAAVHTRLTYTRKTALRAYCGSRRCFTHVPALTPCLSPPQAPCKHVPDIVNRHG